MNPVVIIPTFISAKRRRNEVKGIVSNYDHMTNINEEGNLDRCLSSLEGKEGVGLIMVMVAADRSIDLEAVKKVRDITKRHPDLNIIVIGPSELSIVRERMEELSIEQVTQQICLRGYGAILNLSLIISGAMGFDAVVFLDENEIVDDPEFMRKALYGLGKVRTSPSGRTNGTTAFGSRARRLTPGSAQP